MRNFDEVTDDIKGLIDEQKSISLKTNGYIALNMASESYIKVKFPKTKNYMDEEWFEEEAILSGENGEEASFFISLKRVFEKNAL